MTRELTEAELCGDIVYYLRHRFCRQHVPEKEQNSFILTESWCKNNSRILGKHSIPDFVAASVSQNTFSNNVITLYSFEVKTHKGCNVDSVSQTSNYARWSHYNYLVWQIPKQISNKQKRLFDHISEECLRQQVGLILFTESDIHDSYKRIVSPKRMSPLPSDMEDFIKVRFSDQNQVILSGLYRGESL